MKIKGRQTILGEYCTRCMLYLMYACSQCQLMIMGWRDRDGWHNFVFCDDGWVVDMRETDGGWKWEWCERYERIWEIRGTTCLIGFQRYCIRVSTCWIRTSSCHIGDGILTCTQNSLTSHFLMIISPISSDLSLSRPELYHHLRTQSQVIPLNRSTQWSRVNTTL
jgi:hypothetical protein